LNTKWPQAALLLTLSSTLDAQETSQSKTAVLPAVVVVATRTPVEARDVPGSVAVVGAQQIEETQASDIGEVLEKVPGIAIEGGPRTTGAFINIRGLSGPRVLQIVDGARQNFLGGHRSSLLIDPYLLKKMEVLRGPASALWGSDALGGVMLLTTKDAADILDPGQRWSIGLRSGYESAANERLNGVLMSGRAGDFDAVADFSQRQSQDYTLADGSRQPHSALKTDAGLAKLTWLPDSSQQFSLGYQGYRNRGQSPSNPAIEINDTNPLLDRNNDQRYLNARYAYMTEDADATLLLGQFNLYRNDLRIIEDRVDQPRHDQTDFNTTGASSHVILALSDMQRLTVGGEYYRDGARASRDGAPRPQYPDSQRNIGGVFAQTEIELGDFSIVPGLRYDRYQSRSNTNTAAAVHKSSVSPKLGVVYHAGDDLRLRAGYAAGFRAPSLIELYAAGQHFLGNNFVPNPSLTPERARNLEVGFDWRRHGFSEDQRFMLSGSVYRNRIYDFIELDVQVTTEVPALQCATPFPPVGCVNRNADGTINPLAPPIFVGGTTTSRNLTRATLIGGELETAYVIGPVQWSASYSTVRGRNEDNRQTLSTIPADRLRSELQWNAPWNLSAQLGYTYAFTVNDVPTASDGSNVMPPTPAWSRWDSRLSWALPTSISALRDARLVAGIDNLTNADYREHLNALRSPGRSYRISLSARF